MSLTWWEIRVRVWLIVIRFVSPSRSVDRASLYDNTQLDCQPDRTRIPTYNPYHPLQPSDGFPLYVICRTGHATLSTRQSVRGQRLQLRERPVFGRRMVDRERQR